MYRSLILLIPQVVPDLITNIDHENLLQTIYLINNISIGCRSTVDTVVVVNTCGVMKVNGRKKLERSLDRLPENNKKITAPFFVINGENWHLI